MAERLNPIYFQAITFTGEHKLVPERKNGEAGTGTEGIYFFKQCLVIYLYLYTHIWAVAARWVQWTVSNKSTLQCFLTIL